MHGISARTGAPPARATRASEGHARVLLPCAFLLALVALLIAPVPAYADANYRTVLWSGDYASGKQYIVGADNKYDAAAYICGQTSAQVAAYDMTVRYKLSSTENDFAALADSLEKDWPGWNEDTLAQSLADTFNREVDGLSLWDVMTQSASIGAGGGIILNQGALKLFQVQYWQDSVDCDIYAVDTTSDAVSRARDDLLEILNGGGGGSVPDGDFVTYTANVNYNDNTTGSTSSYYVCSDKNKLGTKWSNNRAYTAEGSRPSYGYVLYPSSISINVSKDVFPQDYSFDNSAVIVRIYDGRLSALTFYENVTPLYRANWTVNTLEYVYDLRYTSTRHCYISLSSSSDAWTFNGSTFTYQKPENFNPIFNTVTDGHDDVSNYDEQGLIYDSGGGTEPDPPQGPGNWPDPPSDPEPPEPPTVPDPPENPEPDPPDPPIAPTPPSPEPPTNVIIPTGTTPQDYTPWLRAILEQLQTLTSELANHCVHLQEEMQISVNELQDTLIRIDNSLENHIWDLFNGLEDYLHDLAVWLADQLDYNVNVDPYDDSSVLYWLRKIYSRLGNKPNPPTTIMDPDPTEPFDFWAWLLNLINNIVGEIITDLVGDVAGLLDAFKSKFPFSIPWDIAALLTLFDGVRATPQFTVRLPAVQGWYNEIVFNIDLTPYNSVAAVCRAAVNIWWVMCLVMRTDWMLGVMDRASSFAERFVRKVYAVE